MLALCQELLVVDLEAEFQVLYQDPGFLVDTTFHKLVAALVDHLTS